MAKEIKVKIIDENKLKFELLENGQVGDYFILNNDQNTQTTQAITKFLENKNINLVNNKILESKVEWEKTLTKRIAEAVKNKELEIDKQWIVKNNEQINELNKQIQQLENDKDNIAQKLENKFLQQTKQNDQEFTKQINSFIEKEAVLKTKLFEQLQNFEKEKQAIEEKAALMAESAWKDERQKLKDEIESLYRNRGVNSKVIGEELENWIIAEFDNAMGLLEDSKLEKINRTIDGKKADFLFTVLHDQKDGQAQIHLTNVVIEAKSQGSSGKVKNEDFLNTLEKNRKNQNAEYALLITEVEPDKEFLIKKISNYENMYMIRPAYFIPFLSLIRLLSLKRKNMITDEINFKEKTEILQKLDELKAEILDNSVKNINKQILEIKRNSDKIIACSEEINKSANVVLNTHLVTLTNKINNFEIKIQTLTKKISRTQEKEKLDNE